MQQALHSLRASSLLTLLAPTEQGFYATTSRIWEQRKLDLLQFRMPTHKRTSEGGGGGAKLLGLTMGLSLAIEAHVFKKKKKKLNCQDCLTSLTQTEKGHILQTVSIILLSKGAFNFRFLFKKPSL